MKLQILTLPNIWEYVFCRNDRRIITTLDRRKALPGEAISYFQRYFPDNTFRVINSLHYRKGHAPLR